MHRHVLDNSRTSFFFCTRVRKIQKSQEITNSILSKLNFLPFYCFSSLAASLDFVVVVVVVVVDSIATV
jgi:hypothetical protein